MPTSEKEIEDVRELVRELHGLVKDARQARRELGAEVEAVRALMQKKFEEECTTVVRAGLEEYQVQLAKHIEEATAAVYRRFDTIAEILVKGPKKRAYRDELSLEEVAIIQAAVAILER